jgi:hypothetical protein
VVKNPYALFARRKSIARPYCFGTSTSPPNSRAARNGKYGSRKNSRAIKTASASPFAKFLPPERFGNHSDRRRRNTDLFADFRRERHLITGRDRNICVRHVAAGRNVDQINADFFQPPLQNSIDCSKSQPFSVQSVAEIRTKTGKFSARLRAPVSKLRAENAFDFPAFRRIRRFFYSTKAIRNS